ncbi:M56 family metallopeptidase [Aquisphaera insulae]|uniref:M56 family metallopeptidase n=1 Tax=Aquisphaera insulae TaxID=2712864 RepID=UPI00196AE1C9|nr:M56 family metallopeptidase [Aquisphaera insulae]
MTIESLTGSRPWLAAGWTMLHFLWVGGAIGLVAAAGRSALRRAAPEVRYASALVCLGLLTAAPVAIFLCINAHQAVESTTQAQGAEELAPLPRQPERPADFPPGEMPDLGAVADRRPVGSRLAPQGWLEAAAAGLPWLWIAGTPLTFGLLAAGLVGADRRRRRCRLLIDGEPVELARRLAGTLGILRPVAVGVCDRLAAPILLGVVRPIILLPAAALSGWSPDQLEMALLHELAHVRRSDLLVNLVQRVVESLLFFHPAVWWVSGWVRLEREHCCDRLVVAHTGRARPYAELLAGLALHAGRTDRVAVAMAENPIVARIRCILNPEDNLMPLSRLAYALVAAMLIAPAALIAASRADAPASKDGGEAAPKADRARIEELIRRTRHGADVFLGVQERVYALIQIAAVQARMGDREAARRTFAEAEKLAETVSFDDATYSPHILFWVIQAEENRGFRDEAIAASRKLLRLTETPSKRDSSKYDVFTNLIPTLIHLGDQDGVKETLQAARRYCEASKDPMFRDGGRKFLLSLQAATGDLKGVLRRLDDPELTREAGPEEAGKLRQEALAAMIRLKNLKDLPAARAILDEALKVARDFKDDGTWGDQTRRNEWLQQVALAQAKLGLFKEAVETAGRIDSETVPAMLAESRKVDFRDEQRWKRAMTLGEIGLAQAKGGDRDGARRSAEGVARILETFRGDRYMFPAWNSAETLARIGMVAEARKVADLLALASRIEVYQVIATACREEGDEGGARTTLEAAVDLASHRIDELKAGLEKPGLSDREPVFEMLELLARLRARLGDRREAFQVIHRINVSNRRGEAMGRLAGDLAAVGDLDGTLEAINAMNAPQSEAQALKYVLGAYSPREPASPAR